MPLRVLEIFLPADKEQSVDELVKQYSIYRIWKYPASDDQMVIKMLLSAQDTEPLTDVLQKLFASVDGFQVLVLSVEAAVPEPDFDESDPRLRQVDQPENTLRVSRDELYNDVSDACSADSTYFLFTLLSTVVAVMGLLRDDVALIIGAMVIAPFLGPNMGVSLSLTLGDIKLARKSLIALVFGLLLALVLSVSLGLVLPGELDQTQILNRTQVSYGDLVLAFCSGIAGALCFATGMASALIGVMVAVALLPPLVVVGLMLAHGRWVDALGAAILLGVNLTCLNFAGLLTFYLKKIRPPSYWAAEKAAIKTKLAIVRLILALLILVLMIWISQHMR